MAKRKFGVRWSASLVVLMGLGCGDAATDAASIDGGSVGDGGRDSAVEPGTARLEIELDTEHFEPGDSIQIGVVSLRAANDRGSNSEPMRSPVGFVLLTDDESEEVSFEAVTPATYGRIVMEVGPGSWGPAFEWIRDGDPRVVVRSTRSVVIDARCDQALSLGPGSSGELELELDAESMASVLDDEDLPEPTGGDLLINEDSAPDVLAEVEEAFAEAWEVSCQ